MRNILDREISLTTFNKVIYITIIFRKASDTVMNYEMKFELPLIFDLKCDFLAL